MSKPESAQYRGPTGHSNTCNPIDARSPAPTRFELCLDVDD